MAKKEQSPGDAVVNAGFNAFVANVKALGISVKETEEPRYWRDPPKNVDPYVKLEWHTGGYSGGSCWDDSDPQPHTTDTPEPEFEAFEKILEMVDPAISHRHFKELAKTSIEYGTRTESEYYGNSTDFAFKKLDLKKLYDGMFILGIIKE